MVGRLGMAASGSCLVYTPHAMLSLNPALGRLGRGLVGRLERSLALVGQAMIAVSGEEKAHAMSLGIPESKLFVVPNGIAPEPTHSSAPAIRENIRAEAGLKESDLWRRICRAARFTEGAVQSIASLRPA
jgi:hypothetical protein